MNIDDMETYWSMLFAEKDLEDTLDDLRESIQDTTFNDDQIRRLKECEATIEQVKGEIAKQSRQLYDRMVAE